MRQGGMLPIFFLHFDSLTSFFEFFSSQGNHKSLKKTGCSYTFQFFWSLKIFEIDVKWRFFWSCAGRNSGFWGSCWSTHRSWQRCRCWKYRTRHWHVWRVFVFKKLLQFKSCNDNMDKLEPWQILRNQQTIRDSWLGLVIVPLVCHCQRSKKKHFSFILRVRGKNAKHCPKNHYLACRKSFLCWAWACVALGWNVYIAMHASWCSPTCVGHACGKPWSLERRHWTSLCSCGLNGANSFACTKDSKMYMWCNDSNWVL